MLQVRDVEEVILIKIREIRFHLRGIHATVGLRHVNGRHAQRRENIARHFFDREIRSAKNRRDRDKHCDGTTKDGRNHERESLASTDQGPAPVMSR